MQTVIYIHSKYNQYIQVPQTKEQRKLVLYDQNYSGYYRTSGRWRK